MYLLTEVERFCGIKLEQAEDWQDIARALLSFIQHKGFISFPVSRPQRTGLGTYMYVVPFEDNNTKRWFVYDADLGIAEFVNKEPIPANYS